MKQHHELSKRKKMSSFEEASTTGNNDQFPVSKGYPQLDSKEGKFLP